MEIGEQVGMGTSSNILWRLSLEFPTFCPGLGIYRVRWSGGERGRLPRGLSKEEIQNKPLKQIRMEDHKIKGKSRHKMGSGVHWGAGAILSLRKMVLSRIDRMC